MILFMPGMHLKILSFLKSYHAPERIQYLVNLATQVRKDGILILEAEAKRTDDHFMRRAFELTGGDGQSHADIKRVLETEMRTSYDRLHPRNTGFSNYGFILPALGLIGTLARTYPDAK